jgi:hypothetical protein
MYVQQHQNPDAMELKSPLEPKGILKLDGKTEIELMAVELDYFEWLRRGRGLLLVARRCARSKSTGVRYCT